MAEYLTNYNYDTTKASILIIMPKPEIFITFRVTEQEKELLKEYCEQEGRTQTDILRELVRGLRRRLKSPPIHPTS